jgi:hypothetical protein
MHNVDNIVLNNVDAITWYVTLEAVESSKPYDNYI